MKTRLFATLSAGILALLFCVLVFSLYRALSSGGGGNFRVIRNRWERSKPVLKDTLGRMITYDKQPVASSEGTPSNR